MKNMYCSCCLTKIVLPKKKKGWIKCTQLRIVAVSISQFLLYAYLSLHLLNLSVVHLTPRELQAMEALQNGQTTSEGGIEGQSAVAASHAMIEKILSEEPRWQGEHQLSSVGLERSVWFFFVVWSASSFQGFCVLNVDRGNLWLTGCTSCRYNVCIGKL